MSVKHKRKRAKEINLASELGVEGKYFFKWQTYCELDLCEKNEAGVLNFDEWLNFNGGKNRIKVQAWFRKLKHELTKRCKTHYARSKFQTWLARTINFSVSHRDWCSTRFLTISTQYAMHQRYRELKDKMDGLQMGKILKVMTFKPLPRGQRLFTILHYRVSKVHLKCDIPDSYLWFQRLNAHARGNSLFVLALLNQNNIIELPSVERYPTITRKLESEIQYRQITHKSLTDLKDQCKTCTFRKPISVLVEDAKYQSLYYRDLRTDNDWNTTMLWQETRPLNSVLNPYMALETFYPDISMSNEHEMQPKYRNEIPIQPHAFLDVRIIPHSLPTGIGDTFQDGGNVRFPYETWWEPVNTHELRNQLKSSVKPHIHINDLVSIILSFIADHDLGFDQAFVFTPNQ